MAQPIELHQRLKSFGHAWRGVLLMLNTQHNAWLHALATVLVVIAGGVCSLTRIEWCLVVLAVAIVWTAEALNTALEFLADASVPQFHPTVGRAKDAAAGGVLLCAVGAAVVGVVVFGPHLLAFAHGVRG